jgi:NADH-quinone oxidoreductase subunit L
MDHLPAFLCLAVFLPLCGAVFAGLLGRCLSPRMAEVTTVCCMLGSMMAACVVFKGVVCDQHSVHVALFEWIRVDNFTAQWALWADSLTAIMLLVVTTVSACVHLYAVGYMHEDPHRQRFMAYLSLFTFAMLMLVTADNFLQLFFGWEGVGLCSYLLIGFWFHKPTANDAAVKAFLAGVSLTSKAKTLQTTNRYLC